MGAVRIFDGEINVHYGFITITAATDDEFADLMDTRRGQINGLCGAAVPGMLSMVTGLHTGSVPLAIDWCDQRPVLEPDWDEVVEVSVEFSGRELTLGAFEEFIGIDLPCDGMHRARWCAAGMDQGRELDNDYEQPAPDRYRLQLWPAPAARDAIVRVTSDIAEYWHREALKLGPPPPPLTAQELTAARREQEEREEQERQEWERAALARAWGGRIPSARMLALRGNIAVVRDQNRDLLDAFEQLDDATHRRIIAWLAHQAAEISELGRYLPVGPALAAIDQGDPLPEPFSDLSRAFELLREATPGSRTGASTWSITIGPRPQYLELHRPSFAIPAICAAGQPDSLQALVDTFSHTAATFNERRGELITELRARFLAGGSPQES